MAESGPACRRMQSGWRGVLPIKNLPETCAAGKRKHGFMLGTSLLPTDMDILVMDIPTVRIMASDLPASVSAAAALSIITDITDLFSLAIHSSIRFITLTFLPVFRFPIRRLHFQ